MLFNFQTYKLNVQTPKHKKTQPETHVGSLCFQKLEKQCKSTFQKHVEYTVYFKITLITNTLHNVVKRLLSLGNKNTTLGLEKTSWVVLKY